MQEHQIALALVRAAVGRAQRPLPLVVVDRARLAPNARAERTVRSAWSPARSSSGEAAQRGKALGDRGGRATGILDLERVAVGAYS